MSVELSVANNRRNPRLESYVRRRVESVMGRRDDRINRVEVHLRDDGGIEKACNLVLHLSPRGQICVSAKHEDIYAAAVMAVNRAEQALAKAVERNCRSKNLRHAEAGVRRDTARVVDMAAVLDSEFEEADDE